MLDHVIGYCVKDFLKGILLSCPFMDDSALQFRPNACMLVINRERRLFLGERAGEPGIWQFPQGGVEEASSLEENVLRELNEEMGVPPGKLRIIGRLKATHSYEWDNPPEYARNKWKGQSQTFWLVMFEGDDSDIDLDASGDPELSSWRWCTIEEVKELAEPKRLKGYLEPLREVEEYFKCLQ